MPQRMNIDCGPQIWSLIADGTSITGTLHSLIHICIIGLTPPVSLQLQISQNFGDLL